MKKAIVFFALLCFAGATQADEWQSLFREGNSFYEQAEYEQAIQKYHQILRYGYSSGELYFNLGNAYYKLDKIGMARLNYERALTFLKNDEALNENMRMVKIRLIDQIQKPPQFILALWWNALLDFFSLSVLSVISVIFLWIFLGMAGLRLYFWRRNRLDRTRAFFTVSLVLFLISAFLLTQKIYQAETEEYAVIINPVVTVYAEPREGGTEIFVLHEGTRVKVERRNQEWLEIKLDDGKTGWLESKMLEII